MKLNFFKPKNFFGLKEITTVSNGPEEKNQYGLGANDIQARSFENSMRHGTTEEAVNNTLGRLLQTPITNGINFGGHGMPGSFETGSGQTGWDYNKMIQDWNEDYWNKHLLKLQAKDYPIFTIYSCRTGAREQGASLLFKMAKLLGKPVRARTGDTICYYRTDGACWIEFQPGSEWQTAFPDKKPTPIEPPQTIFSEYRKSIYMLLENDKTVEFNFDEIENLTIEFIQIKLRGQTLIEDIDKNIILSGLFSGTPQIIEGLFLAFATHGLKFVYQGKQYEFTIYNNQIAKLNGTNQYFYGSTTIENYLISL